MYIPLKSISKIKIGTVPEAKWWHSKVVFWLKNQFTCAAILLKLLIRLICYRSSHIDISTTFSSMSMDCQFIEKLPLHNPLNLTCLQSPLKFIFWHAMQMRSKPRATDIVVVPWDVRSKRWPGRKCRSASLTRWQWRTILSSPSIPPEIKSIQYNKYVDCREIIW